MKRKLVSLMLVVSMTAAMVAGCGSDDKKTADNNAAGTEKTDDSKEAASGSVYYLNFKPEQDQQWQDLAKAYTDETGVPVTVVTAASGNYETTLMSEMGKSGAPTLFQVNGPVGLANWKDYCYDLAGSDIYGQLTSDNYALKEDDTVYGIAYVIESYGLIVNKTLLEKAGYTIDDIQSFADLKKVAEVEALCFPAAEAAGYEDFMERYKTCKNSFFVAETEDGEIAGFCNGCCADTDYLADALYHDATLHNPDGDYQMIFGLDVNPKFQKQGIGEALMRHMVKSAGERDKKAVVLTCKDHMIPFYKRIGYEYIELSDSTHGGAKWHKMMYRF